MRRLHRCLSFLLLCCALPVGAFLCGQATGRQADAPPRHALRPVLGAASGRSSSCLPAFIGGLAGMCLSFLVAAVQMAPCAAEGDGSPTGFAEFARRGGKMDAASRPQGFAHGVAEDVGCFFVQCGKQTKERKQALSKAGRPERVSVPKSVPGVLRRRWQVLVLWLHWPYVQLSTLTTVLLNSSNKGKGFCWH